MRISKWGWRGAAALAVVAIAAAGLGGVLVGGLEQNGTGPAQNFSSAEDAYRAGVKSLGDEKVADALPALEFAADRGVLGAQLHLSRLYGASGEEHGDDAKALTYYHMIVNQYGDIDRVHPAAQRVSDAFRGLAVYYRKGVPEVGLKPDPQKAVQLIRHAASYFRDPKAQFEIGRMYAEGDGVTRNRRLAIGWLLKASQKKHAPAQAYLGELLWSAKSGERARARGLALLALAADNADDENRGRIARRYHEAGHDANAEEIARAERFVAGWDGFHAGNAAHVVAAQLKALREVPLEAAPVGSLVVSQSGDRPLSAQGAAADSLAGVLMADIAQDPDDNGAGTDPAEAPAEQATPPHTVENFFRDRPAEKVGERGSDLFETVKVDRYSGETLSVDARLEER
ncbi:MAG: tetratricopeptide repeat protein [Dichotomicrobium sp.]